MVNSRDSARPRVQPDRDRAARDRVARLVEQLHGDGDRWAVKAGRLVGFDAQPGPWGDKDLWNKARFTCAGRQIPIDDDVRVDLLGLGGHGPGALFGRVARDEANRGAFLREAQAIVPDLRLQVLADFDR